MKVPWAILRHMGTHIASEPPQTWSKPEGMNWCPQGWRRRWLSSRATATLGQEHLAHGQSEVGLPQVMQGLGVAREKK